MMASPSHIPPIVGQPSPTRPVLRWHGGKWRLAPRILPYLPQHRCYVEPFGGAASLLLRKPRAYAEVYNDLDRDVVSLFRILRDEMQAARLIEMLRLTPFARAEFEAAYSLSDDPFERAYQLVVRSYMGFGSDGLKASVKTGFRKSSSRSGTTPAGDWMNYPDCLALIVARLRGVVIECRDALAVIADHDRADTLIYADPPYMMDTRSTKNGYHGYNHELDRGGHERLLAALRAARGMVVLSGYASDLYDAALSDWRRVEIPAMADGARPRTEVLWINPAADAALKAGGLFEVVQ